LDGLDTDGGLNMYEPKIDIAYRDDNGDKVIVKNKWAHVGEEGAPSNYEGFVHSVNFGMSDTNTSYNGFNHMSWKIERGSNLDENIKQASVTIEYNNDNYANTLNYDTGGTLGNVLMDINSQSTEMKQDKSAMEQVFGSYGSKISPVYLPLDQDGNFVLSDNITDGFFMKFSLKPIKTDAAQPVRMPPVEASVCDLNCNGITELADAIISLKIQAGDEITNFCFGDINKDGKTGMAETIYILQFVAGLK